MDQKKIERISELTRISRTRELTEEEQQERQALRGEYLQAIRQNFTQMLDNTDIKRPDGTVEPLRRTQKPKPQ